MSWWSTAWDDIVNAAANATSAITFNSQNIGGFKNAYFNAWDTSAYASATGNVTIDLSTYQNVTITLTGNVTLSFTAPGGPCKGTLIIKQNGTGGYTVAWPTSKKLNGAVTIQAAANAITIVSYIYDGSTYYLSPGLGPMT